MYISAEKVVKNKKSISELLKAEHEFSQGLWKLLMCLYSKNALTNFDTLCVGWLAQDRQLEGMKTEELFHVYRWITLDYKKAAVVIDFFALQHLRNFKYLNSSYWMKLVYFDLLFLKVYVIFFSSGKFVFVLKLQVPLINKNR